MGRKRARIGICGSRKLTAPDTAPSRLDSAMSRRLAYSLAIALMLSPCGVALAQVRSRAVVAEFKRLAPCPATGKPAGPCQGWEVDHVTPLKCGGSDAVANLQWLTTAEHRKKTAREAKLNCRQLAREKEE